MFPATVYFRIDHDGPLFICTMVREFSARRGGLCLALTDPAATVAERVSDLAIGQFESPEGSVPDPARCSNPPYSQAQTGAAYRMGRESASLLGILASIVPKRNVESK